MATITEFALHRISAFHSSLFKIQAPSSSYSPTSEAASYDVPIKHPVLSVKFVTITTAPACTTLD
jgi:hypothetical protein